MVAALNMLEFSTAARAGQGGAKQISTGQGMGAFVADQHWRMGGEAGQGRAGQGRAGQGRGAEHSLRNCTSSPAEMSLAKPVPPLHMQAHSFMSEQPERHKETEESKKRRKETEAIMQCIQRSMAKSNSPKAYVCMQIVAHCQYMIHVQHHNQTVIVARQHSRAKGHFLHCPMRHVHQTHPFLQKDAETWWHASKAYMRQHHNRTNTCS